MSVDTRPPPTHHYTPSGHSPLSLTSFTSSPSSSSTKQSWSPSASLSPPSSPELVAVKDPAAFRIKHEHHHHHHHQLQHAQPQPQHSHHHGQPLSPSCSLVRRSFWNLSCSCLFSTLPDEILLFDVFSFFDAKQLTVVQGVCTRWRFLSSDRMLWRELDLSSVAARMDDRSLRGLLSKFGSSLSVLKLCSCSRLTPQLFSASPSPFASLASLRELHFCSLKAVQDEAVIAIAAAAPLLQHVSLYGCVQLTDTAILALTASSPRLEELSLRGLHRITNAALASVGESLRGLNIAGCKLINSEGVKAVAQRCPALERLNAHAINLTDEAVDELTRRCSALSTLHLSSANPFGGNQLTDEAVLHLARLPALTCLNLQGSSNITDAAVVALLSASASPSLIRLNLGGCYRLTDVTVTAIASSRSAATLTHLSLFQCFHVSDAAISQLLLSMDALQHLDLHSCVQLTGAVLQIVGSRRAGEGGEDGSGSRSSSRMSQRGLSDSDSEAEEEDEDGVRRRRSRGGAEEELKAEEAAVFHVPALTTLDIGSCRHVKAADVEALRATRPQLNIVHY